MLCLYQNLLCWDRILCSLCFWRFCAYFFGEFAKHLVCHSSVGFKNGLHSILGLMTINSMFIFCIIVAGETRRSLVCSW